VLQVDERMQSPSYARWLPQLYPSGELCYNPNIEHTHTSAGTDDSSRSSEPEAVAQTPIPSYGQQDLVFDRAFALLRDAVAERAFPAASLAVTHAGKLVCLKGFGRFTYEPDSSETTAATIFDLASLTKPIATTTMAAILYERGLLDLDMPVAGVVRELAGEDPRRSEITIRQLLAHSSGLPAYEKLFLRARTKEELLRATFTMPLAYEPGERAEYSDLGFILLGVSLERLAEDSLDHFCEQNIFGPLGMSRTGFRPPASWKIAIPPTADDRSFRNHVIQGEVQDENASVLGGVAGHAGLFAPAEDFATFAHVLLQGGRPILRQATVELFTRRETSPAGTSRTLGWDTPSAPSQSGRYFSGVSFGHLGYTGTSLWIDPEKQLSVTLLTNRTWPDCGNQAIKQVRPRIHDAIVESLEGRH